MATTLSLDNEDKMANAILDMIRLQSFDVKRKIQRMLAKEIAEEQKKSGGSVCFTSACTRF